MPRGDGTGPAGAGQMTGRGLGTCSGSNTPGFVPGGNGLGCGFRRGAGRGFGFRNRAFPGGAVLQSAEEQVQALKVQMDRIQKQIETLETKS